MNKWIASCIALLLAQSAWGADVPAVLTWSQRVELSLPVSGVVQSVQVEAGTTVKQGHNLLNLDTTSLQARVAESTAEISRLTAEAAESKRDLGRTQELHERTVVSTTELDQAKLRHIRAQSLLEEARARLKQRHKALQDATLRAPFDAVVIQRLAEPGQSVAATLQPQPLMVLARAGEMLARMQLTSAQLEHLKTGQNVQVISGGKSYPGRIKSIALEPQRIKDELLYAVDVLLTPAEQLRAGSSATVKLP